MAEVLATMVVGPLVSMVKEKASSYLLEQYQVMEGLEKQHKLLKRKLPAILDVITDAEEQAAAKREGAKAWLEEVRQVAYQANDVLDEFKYEALRRKAREEGHYKELGMDVIKLFPSHNRFVFRIKMGNKLRMILEELDVLIAEMNCFGFKFRQGPPVPVNHLRENSSKIIDPVDIAGRSRAGDKKKIIKSLLDKASNVNLTVFPVVGMGGMGKTTLAQLVYNDPDIQKHFQLRLWVCVSDNFDVDSLAERIVEEAKKNGCQANGSSALDKLQNAVSGKRYLLVLDDVWNRDEAHKWEKLKSYLQHGGSGSSVLITTRDQAVAQLMMGTATGAYELGRLGENFIEEIIRSRAFSSKQEKDWPRELVNMVGDVAKRCAGSPLAATALGSVLSTKTTAREWKDVLRRKKICDDRNGILPVLKLSYNCLPSHMRQCFAFCAMFPKDYEIDVEMLIQLWMANGFISVLQGEEHPEISGKNIFIELASRSFFQDVKGIPFEFTDIEVSRVTCKIHDLMHDVALDSMGKECAAIATEQSKSGDFPHSARHLLLSVYKPETLLNASQEKGSPVIQTLICEKDVDNDLQHLSKYRSARALKITGGLELKQTSFLKPVWLHHLRYLDLSGSYAIKSLPEDISILYHLQTLNLSGCRYLERLPKGMKYMTALRHLYTHGSSRYITSLSSLELLADDTETESVAEQNSSELVHGREKWEHRSPLARMHLRGYNLLFSHSSALPLWTCFAQLEHLTIWWCDSLVYWPENVFQALVSLRNLRIWRCSKLTGRTQETSEQSAPERSGLLPCLESLSLDDCPSLVEVPNLPASLKTLHIYNFHMLGSIIFGQQEDTSSSLIPGSSSTEAVLKLSSSTSHPFLPCLESLDIMLCRGLSEVANLPPSIKTLEIWECDNLRSLSGQLDALQTLNINRCSNLKSLESCLGRLPSLENLSLYMCRSLQSLPNGPQTYSYLRALWIQSCPGIKLLPSSLQQRLDHLEEKTLDARYEGWEYSIRRRLACLK
ncbi:hypothetical protein SETIT_3G099900v2 [Setaria italica]|uniref:Uncharacterized protein n=1 Tax=Setaria italica TaxID=4555 RepID=A0A368QDG0_SETIT|nr:hypothetical protein SETIT_3G099900v2 [Setaria italica]RCV15980.1 hypothetical protein SETIT_3G099900v2 [Setaria italica]